MAIEAANGNILRDDLGNKWVDYQSGILNSPLGHRHESMLRAFHEIIDSGLVNTYDRTSDWYTRFLLQMNETEPRFVWKPFNSGGEAMEKAIQIAATKFGKLPKIAVLPGAFHGKLLSMAWANIGFDAPWGNPLNMVQIDPNQEDDMVPFFDVLIYEPIQGHDGKVNDEKRLRQLCNARGALLIADEMITGFFRCGPLFMNRTADIMITGKGVSQGVPLSLVGYRREILPQGNIAVGWRSTGAGNNLAMCVGYHTLTELMSNQEHYQKQVRRTERRLTGMGFDAHGAFGFRRMKHHAKAKAYFEEKRIIGSWHYAPFLRVGPSFITSEEQLSDLEDAVLEADLL